MPSSDPDQEKVRREQETIDQRNATFTSGLFQGDVTVRTLLESLAEGVVIIGDTGTILLVNTASEHMFGYQRNELIGKSHAVLLPERFRVSHENYLSQYIAEPRIEPTGQLRDLTGRRRDGSEFPVEFSLSHIETINGVLVMALVSDITDRKMAQEALRDNEALFRTMADTAPVLIWMSGTDTLCTFFNKPWLEFTGRTLEQEQGNGWTEGVHPDDIQRCLDTYLSAFYAHRDFHMEYRLRRADGEYRWIVDAGVPRFKQSNDFAGYVGSCFDLTERKRAEEALRESENKFSTAFQATPSVLVISSLADGKYLEVNEAFERVMDYRRDEVIGQTSLDLNVWKDPKDRANVVRMLRSGKKVRDVEVGFRNKSGENIVGLYSAEIIDIGEKPCLLSLVNDITARKKAEEELRQNEERYRSLYNETPVMLHSIDHDGRLLFVSNYWLETLGYKRSEVLGRISTEFLTEASRSYATEVVLPEFFRTGSCKEVPYKFVKKTGEILDVLLSATAERDSEGKVVRSLAVMIDVTERKRAEEKIERLSTDLSAHAAELEAANRELEAFNYTVAHDLRKPLTVVNGYCQVIRELCGSNLTEQCKDYLQAAYDATLRMNRLIDALLNFSRLSHIEPRRVMVDLSAMANEVATELQLSEPERRVTFRIANAVSADGDAALLQVVLDNLLGNAWKYTGTRIEGIIEFGTTVVNGKSAWFVRDNGTGFDMTDADNLFNPFRRLPGAEGCQGFGIGLATVQRIILRHRGRIWAEGEPGKGATFYFTLSAENGSR
jgi:PAS domain S-box-containing protein